MTAHPITLVLLSLACLAGPTAATAAPPGPPNFLLLVADDAGFSDLGCYGSEIETRNLDALAAAGVRFTQFYNTARCWPTRSSLMTGYYAQQVNMDPPRGRFPAWARCLPQYLKPLGYRSYHSGKWHVNHAARVVADGGFDHSYKLDDHDRHFAPQRHTLDDVALPPVTGSNYYSSTAIADHAIRWLREHQEAYSGTPFFSYVAFTAPHFPIQAPASDVAKYRERYRQGWETTRAQRYARQRRMGIVDCALAPVEAELKAPSGKPDVLDSLGAGETLYAVPWRTLTDEQKEFQAVKEAVHAAMIDRMDREIGRILDQLRAMDALDNTVIFFLSDNGASAEILVRGDGHDGHAAAGEAGSYLCLGPGGSTVSNTPFRRHKIWTHEGGIATPLIVHWPAGMRARGELRRDVGHVVDILPTLLALAGAPVAARPGAPPFPGISLVPALGRDRATRRDYTFFHHEGSRGLRVGDWKIVSSKGSPTGWELYDLRRDRSETRDLAARWPKRVEAMGARWQLLQDQFRKDGGP